MSLAQLQDTTRHIGFMSTIENSKPINRVFSLISRGQRLGSVINNRISHNYPIPNDDIQGFILHSRDMASMLIELAKQVESLEAELQSAQSLVRTETVTEVTTEPSYTLMTVKEYAKHIGKAPSTVYGQIRSGKLEAIQEKSGHAIRIKVYKDVK